jgi:hypothetical protein
MTPTRIGWRGITVAVLGMAPLLAACGDSLATELDADPEMAVATLRIDPSSEFIVLLLGQGVTALRATPLDSQGRSVDVDARVDWRSTNPSVAEVSAIGQARAVALGDAFAVASLQIGTRTIRDSVRIQVLEQRAGAIAAAR